MTKNKVVIIMEGGIVRNIISKDKEIEVLVIERDFPLDEAPEDTLEHYVDNNVVPLFADQRV